MASVLMLFEGQCALSRQFGDKNKTCLYPIRGYQKGILAFNTPHSVLQPLGLSSLKPCSSVSGLFSLNLCEELAAF